MRVRNLLFRNDPAKFAVSVGLILLVVYILVSIPGMVRA